VVKQTITFWIKGENLINVCFDLVFRETTTNSDYMLAEIEYRQFLYAMVNFLLYKGINQLQICKILFSKLFS